MVKGEKVYKPKLAELKIEKYDSQVGGEGLRIGYKELNLSDYINKGLKAYTFQMEGKGLLFLTVLISVLEAQQNTDIASMTIRALN
mmetsp:Transcript_13540/g.23052  ORF Transcript_13540/g.23052 Transcript_13540/m.23052 type:complete len:86 (-) Transcript_13540:683-940(-)